MGKTAIYESHVCECFTNYDQYLGTKAAFEPPLIMPNKVNNE